MRSLVFNDCLEFFNGWFGMDKAQEYSSIKTPSVLGNKT
jgi:hypothetical protein